MLSRIKKIVAVMFFTQALAYGTEQQGFNLTHIINEIRASDNAAPLSDSLRRELNYLERLSQSDENALVIYPKPNGLRVDCTDERACQAFINLMRRPVVKLDWHYQNDGGASARPSNYREQERIRSAKNVGFLLSGLLGHGKSSLANFAMFLSTVTGLETLPQAIGDRIARGENIFTANNIRAEDFNTRGQVALGTDWADQLFSPASLLQGLKSLYRKDHMRGRSQIEAMPALYATRIPIDYNSYLLEEGHRSHGGDANPNDLSTSQCGSYFNTLDFIPLGNGDRQWNVTMLDTSGAGVNNNVEIERPDATVLSPNLSLDPNIEKLINQANTLKRIETALTHHRDNTRAARVTDHYNGKILVISAAQLKTDAGKKQIKRNLSFLHDYEMAAHLFVAITHAEELETRDRNATKELLTQCGLAHIAVEKIFFFDFRHVYSFDETDSLYRRYNISAVDPRSGDFSIVEEGGSHHEPFKNFAEKRKLTILKNMASLTALFKALLVNEGDRLTLDGVIASIEASKNTKIEAVDRVRIPSQTARECADLIREIRSGQNPDIADATCACTENINITSKYDAIEAEIITLLAEVEALQGNIKDAMDMIWQGNQSDTNLNDINFRLTRIRDEINTKREALAHLCECRTGHHNWKPGWPARWFVGHKSL